MTSSRSELLRDARWELKASDADKTVKQMHQQIVLEEGKNDMKRQFRDPLGGASTKRREYIRQVPGAELGAKVASQRILSKRREQREELKERFAKVGENLKSCARYLNFTKKVALQIITLFIS